jgi:hypothetical protein
MEKRRELANKFNMEDEDVGLDASMSITHRAVCENINRIDLTDLCFADLPNASAGVFTTPSLARAVTELTRDRWQCGQPDFALSRVLLAMAARKLGVQHIRQGSCAISFQPVAVIMEPNAAVLIDTRCDRLEILSKWPPLPPRRPEIDSDLRGRMQTKNIHTHCSFTPKVQKVCSALDVMLA